jgi:pyruvate formate lyase activating enzyme
LTIRGFFRNGKKTMQPGIIFDIKRYAIHDGPGIRTTVFLKGCPLSCWWCHNPEGLKSVPQGLYLKERCIGCGACAEVCPWRAIAVTNQGIVTDTSICMHCGTCARVCPAEAREVAGKSETVEPIMKIIVKDIPFYDTSGGGVTISGGEPLLQVDFLLELLERCGKHDIHRAVDTTGYAEPDIIEAVAAKAELFLFDLKLMDSAKHKKYTGVSNRKILRNLERLAAMGADIIIRVPLVPGINIDDENIEQTGAYVATLPGVRRIDLLPFHNAAGNKYRKFGLTYRTPDILPPAADQLRAVVKRLEKFGLQVAIGG